LCKGHSSLHCTAPPKKPAARNTVTMAQRRSGAPGHLLPVRNAGCTNACNGQLDQFDSRHGAQQAWHKGRVSLSCAPSPRCLACVATAREHRGNTYVYIRLPEGAKRRGGTHNQRKAESAEGTCSLYQTWAGGEAKAFKGGGRSSLGEKNAWHLGRWQTLASKLPTQ